MQIRNIAIIAHVDHGKTTLTDSMLRQTNMMTEEGLSMDSNQLERERGITIYAKNTAVIYKDTKINIVDTPGHADFGSEVERVLRAVDAVLLVVDAQEGPMPQTKFVLKKSLEVGLKPIIVINKIDKPAADPKRALDLVLELFIELGATSEQLEAPVVYAIGKLGIAKTKLEDESSDLVPLFETILKEVQVANSENYTSALTRFQPFNLGYDNYLGRLAIGRMVNGSLTAGSKVIIKKPNGDKRTGSITKIFTFAGFSKTEVAAAETGDLVVLAGIADIDIGETICVDDAAVPLPAIAVDEPTLTMDIIVNNSPFAGREGKFVTTRQIRERLERELETNVGLKVDFSDADRFRVSGRGELHLSVLLENMRREGFEMQVSQPKVIMKEEEGVLMEPFEEVIIDTPDVFVGAIIEKLSKRKGQMLGMAPTGGETRLTFSIPTRGLLGYRGQFLLDTRGEGILTSRVSGFLPHAGDIEKRSVGSMISMENGKALGYSLWNLQDRGTLYIHPNTEVYEGMVIGNTAKGEEMNVNPTKGKQLTNMRASGSDDAILLTPPLELTLERGLEIMADDEYLEITPSAARLRKQRLKEHERRRG